MSVAENRDAITRTAALIATPLSVLLIMSERVSKRLRGLLFKLRIMAIGGEVGKKLSVGPRVRLITARGAKFRIGDRVSLGTGVVLIVSRHADFTVGDDAYIGHYTVIGAESSLSIAARVQIAEHCSIRDHDHDTSAISMLEAPVVCGSVTIGTDSWIGRGVAVLKGARVGAGAVVGANAVVRGDIPPQAIAIGAPARVVRLRQPVQRHRIQESAGSGAPALRDQRGPV